GPFAFRAEVQVIRPVGFSKIKSQYLGDLFQVFDMGLGSEFLPRMRAYGHSPSFALGFVQVSPQLRQPLKNMEKLAKGKPYEKKNHRNGMGHRHKLVGLALQKGIVIRYPQSGHRNGNKQD